jgi:hypothetical protein
MDCTCESTTQPITWYWDNDGDSFGDAAKTRSSCMEEPGWVMNGDDCDDNDADIWPGAACTNEFNCGGAIDATCTCFSATEPIQWYTDADGDGFGDPAMNITACWVEESTPAYVDNGLDCDDNDANGWFVNAPCDDNGASECGGIVGADCKCESGAGGDAVYFKDEDQDGFGDPNRSTKACGAAPTGYVNNNLDCDDMMPGFAQGEDCYTGTDCDTFWDPACYCATTDPDRDGVCDGIDMCPNEDDKID